MSKKHFRQRLAYKLLRVGAMIHGGSDVFPSIQYVRTKKWRRLSDAESLRFDYPLQSDSIVFDLGGYKGEWSEAISKLYSCRIFIFEPMKKYYDNILAKLGNKDSIEIFNFGLADADGTNSLSVDEESSSIFGTGPSEEIVLTQANKFIIDHKVDFIDLIKINIEGAEYDLLDHLIEEGLTSKMRNIQIQFHDFVPNALNRMVLIQNLLSKTHELTYQELFVWENWKLKSDVI